MWTRIFVIITAWIWYLIFNSTTGQRYSVLIKNDVRIYREDNGIPHIHASTLKEAYFGLGITHAQDRLWQLHMRRMTAQGRLSEMLGPFTLDLDKYLRNLAFQESAKRIVEKMDDETRSILQSYADGINYGRDTLAILPIEFQLLFVDFHPWTIYDSICFHKLISLVNINDFFQEFLRTYMDQLYGREMAKRLAAIDPSNAFDSDLSVISQEEYLNLKFNFQKTTNLTGNVSEIDIETLKKHSTTYFSNFILPTFKASNAWVVHGNKTVSGLPYLANDPHLDNEMPSVWYQAEVLFGVGATQNFIIGGTLPGLPFALSGRSKYFAWGLTTLYSDTADLYEEKVVGTSYEFRGKMLPLRVTKEVIKVRGGDDYHLEISHTHHGPILDHYIEGDKLKQMHTNSYSLSAIFHIDDLDGPKGIYNFQQGKDLKKSLEYMKNIAYPNNAMLFASVDNHIAYLATGRIVLRDGNPDDGSFVKPGWTGTHEWIRYLTAEEQPLIFDPPKGYIVTANNKYLPKEDILSWNSQPTGRGRRLANLLASKEKFNLQDMIDFQNDISDSYAEITMPIFLKLVDQYKSWDNIDRSIIIDHCLSILSNWDFKMNDSPGATLFGAWEYFYTKKFHPRLADHLRQEWAQHYMFDSFHFKNLGDLLNSKVGEIIRYAPYCQHTTEKDKCIMNIIYALQEAHEYLNFNQGPTSQWHWSGLHNQVFPHRPFDMTPLKQFFNRQIPYKGSRRTPHVSRAVHDGTFNGDTGANYKMIISLHPDDPNYYIIDTGSSGSVFSKHYDDQMQLWMNGKYLTMKFGEEYDHPQLLQISPLHI